MHVLVVVTNDTVLADAAQTIMGSSRKYVTSYYRNKFSAYVEPYFTGNVSLRLLVDDGMVVYLNSGALSRCRGVHVRAPSVPLSPSLSSPLSSSLLS
jgi:hypothetical protein